MCSNFEGLVLDIRSIVRSIRFNGSSAILCDHHIIHGRCTTRQHLSLAEDNKETCPHWYVFDKVSIHPFLTSEQPMPVKQKVLKGDAYYRWYWRDKARPTTPANAISSYFGKNPPTPSPTSTAKPEMAYSKKGRASVRESTGRYSMMTHKSYKSCKTGKTNRTSKVPTISVRDLSINDSAPPTPTSMTSRSKNRYTRWSWTNSEAPSTPKLHIDPKRSSAGSFSKYHPTRASGNFLMEAIEEDRITPVTSNSGLPAYTNSPDNKSTNSGGLRTFWNRKDSAS